MKIFKPPTKFSCIQNSCCTPALSDFRKLVNGHAANCIGDGKHVRKSSSIESITDDSSSSSTGDRSSTDSEKIPGMAPDEALKQYSAKLSRSEKMELLTYQRIYYVGSIERKRTPKSAEFNDGYDDENGSYLIVLHDHIAYRYEVLQVIGKGSFGQVSFQQLFVLLQCDIKAPARGYFQNAFSQVR